MMKKILIIAAILLVAYLVYKFVIKKDDGNAETSNEPSEADKAQAKLSRENKVVGIAAAGADISNVGFARKLRGS